MPRVRPDDFKQLNDPCDDDEVWARWWRHRDGTVTHVHYGRGPDKQTRLLFVHRRDPRCTVFDAQEAVHA